MLGHAGPRPPCFRCFLFFTDSRFIHFIQNAKIASAKSEKFFLKKRQNYQPFSEIIPFAQSTPPLLLATCLVFFPASPIVAFSLIASRTVSRGRSIKKMLSYFIKREVLGLFCGAVSPCFPMRALRPSTRPLCEEGKSSSALLPCMGAPPHAPGAFAGRSSQHPPMQALRPEPG